MEKVNLRKRRRQSGDSGSDSESGKENDAVEVLCEIEVPSAPPSSRRRKRLPEVPVAVISNEGTVCENETPSVPVEDDVETEPTAEEDPKDKVNVHLKLVRAVKSIFRTCAENITLIGREMERSAIENFVKTHVIEGKKSGCMYISGAPGTGKTALVSQILDEKMADIKNFDVIQINCMLAGTQPKRIFPLIFTEITKEVRGVDDSIKELEKLIVNPKKNNILLLLDEIDQLLTKDQDVLYRIFEWPFLKNSRVCLIGIANSLDMTDRLLPRLKTKRYDPEILSFSAYTHVEIGAMIRNRIDMVGESFPQLFKDDEKPSALMMQNAAIELCAKKVAAYGDFRKAIDVCRYAFEMLEKEIPPTVDETDPLPRLTVKHVLKVIDLSFGSGNPTVAKILSLTPHQKTLLVVIALMEREKYNPKSIFSVDTTIMRIFEVYIAVCRKMHVISEVSRIEFIDVVNTLETTGLVSILKPSGSRNGTPKATSTLASPFGTKTPKNLKSPSISGSASKMVFGSPAQTKGYMMDPTNRISINCNRQEVEMGIKALPFLHDLYIDGLPSFVLQSVTNSLMNTQT